MIFAYDCSRNYSRKQPDADSTLPMDYLSTDKTSTFGRSHKLLLIGALKAMSSAENCLRAQWQ